MQSEVLPSITTHTERGNSWREKIAEIQELGLRRVALFLTGLRSFQERLECYRLLEEVRRAHDFTIPFVHAISSMSEAEFARLRHDFGTQAFNLHPEWDYPLQYPLSESLRSSIYIENNCFVTGLTVADVEDFGGLCLDLSHLEDSRRNAPAIYDQLVALSGNFTVGANHISAIFPNQTEIHLGVPSNSSHFARAASDLSYLAELPPEAFGPMAALELQNSLSEQVEFIPSVRGWIEAAHSGALRRAA